MQILIYDETCGGCGEAMSSSFGVLLASTLVVQSGAKKMAGSVESWWCFGLDSFSLLLMGPGWGSAPSSASPVLFLRSPEAGVGVFFGCCSASSGSEGLRIVLVSSSLVLNWRKFSCIALKGYLTCFLGVHMLADGSPHLPAVLTVCG